MSKAVALLARDGALMVIDLPTQGGEDGRRSDALSGAATPLKGCVTAFWPTL